VTAGRTLVRRYALALTPGGAGDEAAITTTAVPPLSGGPGTHGSEATHAVTIADNASTVTGVGGPAQQRLALEAGQRPRQAQRCGVRIGMCSAR
jgi:hypothetical protein